MVASIASDGAPPDRLAAMTRAFADAELGITFRPTGHLTRLFDGWELLDPGVVSLPEWRPVPWTDRTPLKVPVGGGVARLRRCVRPPVTDLLTPHQTRHPPGGQDRRYGARLTFWRGSPR